MIIGSEALTLGLEERTMCGCGILNVFGALRVSCALGGF